MGNFVNLSRSGNKLTIEESNHDRDPSQGSKSFLQKLFSNRKENATSATQLKASARNLDQIYKKVNYYDPILDELSPKDNYNDARLKQFKAF